MSCLHRLAAAVVLPLALAGCVSPEMNLLLSLLPEGTFTTPLENLRGVSEPNRRQLVELDQKGDWAGMVAFAQKNLEVDPHNAEWWAISGYANTRLGQHQAAVDAYRQAVRLSPDEVDVWNLLAQSYRASGQPEQAVRTLDNALRINQDSPITWFLLGESFSDLKRPERAVDYYRQAVSRDPKFVEAVYRLGATYYRLGRKSEYDATLKHLRTLSPAAADQLVKATSKR